MASAPWARRHCCAIAAWLAASAMVAIAGEQPEAAATASSSGVGRARAATALVFAAIGPELRSYELDLASATLAARASITLPADIQAGAVHPSGRYLYIAWSDGTASSAGTRHGLSSFRIEPASGGMVLRGSAVTLPSRPIYVSTDAGARHALIAYTNPSGVTVHRIASDGTAGLSMPQAPLQLGVYGHQIRVDASNTLAILVARGNVPNASRTEDPGALNVLGYHNGLLKNRLEIAPNRGMGFHPRYLDFHPSQPWIFVSLSQQNAIAVYQQQKGATVNPIRLFERNSLAAPDHVQPGQLAGVLHVHPSGRFVYLANRATSAAMVDGKPVFAGGENSIAVFAVDPATGEPTLIQDVDTQGMGPVEFAFDASGKILVVANMTRLWVRDAGALRPVPPNLAIFRVRDDGKLDFIRKYDVESGDRTLFWMGVGARR